MPSVIAEHRRNFAPFAAGYPELDCPLYEWNQLTSHSSSPTADEDTEEYRFLYEVARIVVLHGLGPNSPMRQALKQWAKTVAQQAVDINIGGLLPQDWEKFLALL